MTPDNQGKIIIARKSGFRKNKTQYLELLVDIGFKI